MIIRELHPEASGSITVGKMDAALFGREMTVIIYGNSEAQTAYAETCAAYFNDMPSELIGNLKRYSLRYCEDMRKFCTSERFGVPEHVTEETVLDYVRPNCLIVERPKNPAKLAFDVEFSCDWEPEHGMEWTINDGRALYVRDFMCISPWYAAAVYRTECRSYVFDDFSME